MHLLSGIDMQSENYLIFSAMIIENKYFLSNLKSTSDFHNLLSLNHYFD